MRSLKDEAEPQLLEGSFLGHHDDAILRLDLHCKALDHACTELLLCGTFLSSNFSPERRMFV